MSTGLKVWLWIWLILNVLGIGGWVLSATVMAPVMAEMFGGLVTAVGIAGGLMNVLLCVVTTVGIGLILFGGKKLGLYLMIASAAIGFILNIIVGYNVFVALIGQGLVPAITFWIMAAEWHEFT